MKNNIDKIRQKHGMTIKELAIRAGVTEQTIIRIKKGHRAREKTMIKIADALSERIENVFEF